MFLPGGPGADSYYYLSLIEHLDYPGNFWLIDFPANGNNTSNDISIDYDFNLWENYFLSAIQRFENPILVGQSFGGMFPLLFPQLEDILSGFIIFNSAPTLWFEAATAYAKENNISTMSESGIKFRENPTPETFRAALLANAHFKTMQNAGHFLWIDQMDLVKDAIDSFLNEVLKQKVFTNSSHNVGIRR